MRITRWMEDLGSVAFLGLVALLASPTLAPFVLDGTLGLMLGTLVVPTGFIAGVAAMSRRLVGSLPLQLAQAGLHERGDNADQYRFRVQLGRGRTMRDARATVTWRGANGEVPLTPLLAEAAVLIGPWTLLVVDKEGSCDGDGVFDVHVVAVEQGKQWQAHASWEKSALVEGRFEPAVAVQRGKLIWQRDRWDAVSPLHQP